MLDIAGFVAIVVMMCLLSGVWAMMAYVWLGVSDPTGVANTWKSRVGVLIAGGVVVALWWVTFGIMPVDLIP